MLPLLQAISLEGWVDVMYNLIDGCSIFVILYFLLLVFLGAIIIINLFLAVLCEEFNSANSDGKEGDKEQEKADAKAHALLIRRLTHANPIRLACLRLVRYKPFDWFIQACILINTAIMCFKFAPTPVDFVPTPSDPHGGIDLTASASEYMPFGYFVFLYVSNIVLTLVFTLESVVKIIALGGLFWKVRSPQISPDLPRSRQTSPFLPRSRHSSRLLTLPFPPHRSL